MIRRDAQGRQVYILEETADALGMTVTDGTVYRFRGRDYRAALENQSSEAVAYFHPIGTPLGVFPMFLNREGTLIDDTDAIVGDYNELEAL
jgi:hypothetical protein